MTSARLRIAVIANGDPLDPATWSGTPLHMLRALQLRFDVVLVIGDRWPPWYRPLGRALKLLSGGRFAHSWSPAYGSFAARRTKRRLRKTAPDVVIAIAATDIAYLLPPELPLVSIGDAVIPELVTYYDMYRRLPRRLQKRAEKAEEAAFERSIMVHFPSAWGVESAKRHYGVPVEKLLKIAWGANSPFQPREPRTLKPGPIRLLFVGSDWNRKGGPIAIATVEELNRRGLSCALDVVGCQKPAEIGADDRIRFHGFVHKTTAEGRKLLEALYAEASLFFLPTTAEAYGIVFAEAAHHGLPSVAYATGGVTSVVRADETGLLLPPEAAPIDFAATIEALVSDPEAYARMSRTALADARDRLNWDVWSQQLERAIRDRLGAAAFGRPSA